MVRVQNKEQISKKIWQADIKEKLPQPEKPEPEENKIKIRGGSKYGLWFVAGVSVLFLLFSFSFVFSGATVTIGPRIEELILSQDFTAVKDGAEGDLPFDLVVLSGEEDKSIEGGEIKNVSKSAEGIVVIYNAFSSASQKLAIDTRLEGSNGKIYKTKIPITVPGMKGATPGSVEVRIYATLAGEAYNSAPLDFKIFGFKGTPKYSKFYARSKGEINGGFIGQERQVSDLDKTKTLNELKTNLKLKLAKKATDQIPSGFVLFKDAVYLFIDDENSTPITGSTAVSIKVKGTLYGILFEEKALTKKITKESFPGEEENEIYIQNIRDLTFSIPSTVATSDQKSIFENLKTVNFHLAGISNAIWKVDEEKLLADILGQKKKDFNQILMRYPNILSANLSLRPFWKRSLPDEPKDIELLVNYP